MILENTIIPHSPRRKILFENRASALEKLLANMPQKILNASNKLVLSCRLSGICFGFDFAAKLKADFDFMFIANIFAPNNNECEIAAVSESREIMYDEKLRDSFGISLDYIYGEAERRRDEWILPSIYKYRKARALSELKNKSVIFVDEGANSGLAASVAVESALELGAKAVYFVLPVASKEVVQMLQERSDGVFCLNEISEFVDIQYYYKEYPPLEQMQIDAAFNGIESATKAAKEQELKKSETQKSDQNTKDSS